MIIDYDNFYIVNNRSVIDFHFFYVYYDGETYYHELHELSYQNSNQKQKCVKVKCGPYELATKNIEGNGVRPL